MSRKKGYSFLDIALTNLRIFSQFLAHIILLVHFTKSLKITPNISVSLSIADVVVTSSKMRVGKKMSRVINTAIGKTLQSRKLKKS